MDVADTVQVVEVVNQKGFTSGRNYHPVGMIRGQDMPDCEFGRFGFGDGGEIEGVTEFAAGDTELFFGQVAGFLQQGIETVPDAALMSLCSMFDDYGRCSRPLFNLDERHS
ncbi:MAG: hypothetical protein ACD_75C01233G0003 [uncultured bacterium]|nr:MAG: hypothetical protein ACD_75C01233G0003 [uncultured bacterium]